MRAMPDKKDRAEIELLKNQVSCVKVISRKKKILSVLLLENHTFSEMLMHHMIRNDNLHLITTYYRSGMFNMSRP